MHNITDILEEKQFYDLAEQAYFKAIELDPKLAHPYSGLADLLDKTERVSEALEPAIKGVCLGPGVDFTHYIFLKVCPDSSEPWLKVLPEVMNYLKKHPDEDEVYSFALAGLIRLVRYKKDEKVLELVKATDMQEKFEPLLLALQARSDRKVLSSLAPERRALVIEVMGKIEKEQA